MVIIKAAKAEGSFLGFGTHVWIEVIDKDMVKTTFSGAKAGKHLAVFKNYKRDYDKEAKRGEISIPAPPTISENEWDKIVIQAGDFILNSKHMKLLFTGYFPCGKKRGNCCLIAKWIIAHAGGAIRSDRKLKGFTPGLIVDC